MSAPIIHLLFSCHFLTIWTSLESKDVIFEYDQFDRAFEQGYDYEESESDEIIVYDHGYLYNTTQSNSEDYYNEKNKRQESISQKPKKEIHRKHLFVNEYI